MPVKKVVLAEDDFDDRIIFREAFREIGDDSVTLETLEDGLEVINLLKCVMKDEDLPDLLILDQNMPKMTGKATLAYLKSNERYCHIPVIIYSTYPDEYLIKEFTTLGADLVISKPNSYDGFKEMVHRFINIVLVQK